MKFYNAGSLGPEFAMVEFVRTDYGKDAAIRIVMRPGEGQDLASAATPTHMLLSMDQVQVLAYELAHFLGEHDKLPHAPVVNRYEGSI